MSLNWLIIKNSLLAVQTARTGHRVQMRNLWKLQVGSIFSILIVTGAGAPLRDIS